MRDLGPPLRLEVGQQLEPPGVVGAVVHPAQRHDAVGVIAAAERARRQVRGRDALGLQAHDAGAADDLLALRLGGAERRAPARALARRPACATARAAAACAAAASPAGPVRCAAACGAAAARASCRAPVARVGVDADEPVADAPHVLDPAPVAGGAELGAQPAGVAVERARARRGSGSPRRRAAARAW